MNMHLVDIAKSFKNVNIVCLHKKNQNKRCTYTINIIVYNAKNNEIKAILKNHHIPIISGTPFFSTTRRASSSTLLFDLCKNNIKTLIIISINHPQKFKTIQPTHLATPISNPITFLLQERTQCFAQ